MSTTTIDKLCILTSGRTGSTFIIDALQKSGRVYALSEILRPDYIPNHFDISHPDGFLNKRVSSRGGAPPTLCPRREWGVPPHPRFYLDVYLDAIECRPPAVLCYSFFAQYYEEKIILSFWTILDLRDRRHGTKINSSKKYQILLIYINWWRLRLIKLLESLWYFV